METYNNYYRIKSPQPSVNYFLHLASPFLHLINFTFLPTDILLCIISGVARIFSEGNAPAT